MLGLQLGKPRLWAFSVLTSGVFWAVPPGDQGTGRGGGFGSTTRGGSTTRVEPASSLGSLGAAKLN